MKYLKKFEEIDLSSGNTQEIEIMKKRAIEENSIKTQETEYLSDCLLELFDKYDIHHEIDYSDDGRKWRIAGNGQTQRVAIQGLSAEIKSAILLDLEKLKPIIEKRLNKLIRINRMHNDFEDGLEDKSIFISTAI